MTKELNVKIPRTLLMLAAGLFVAAPAVAPDAASARADRGAIAAAASKLICAPDDPLCSVGREAAQLSVSGDAPLLLTTNDGRREVSKHEVNSRGKASLSGCVNNYCVLYWVPPRPDFEGRWAIVLRRNVLVRRPRRGGPWVRASGTWGAGKRVYVRRLGGPPIRQRHPIRRKLIANPALKGIYHRTAGPGQSPLLNYSCSDFREPGCRYVTAADAPPNTPPRGPGYRGGKGYTSGVYRSGTTFYATGLTTRVPVFRLDGREGMARWVYGFIRWRGRRVWGWVIHSVRIGERNGRVTTYPGYLR